MNVFYNRSTRGLKNAPTPGEAAPEYSATIYLTEHFAYTIDSEGTMSSSARFIDGSYDNEEWVEVDFEGNLRTNGTVYHTMLTAVQDCLECDAMHSGWYFKTEWTA